MSESDGAAGVGGAAVKVRTHTKMWGTMCSCFNFLSIATNQAGEVLGSIRDRKTEESLQQGQRLGAV